MEIDGAAAQATRALLQLARNIAEGVLGSAAEETVREVFARLCYETDMREEPTAAAPAEDSTWH